jgi:hypothetical protein
VANEIGNEPKVVASDNTIFIFISITRNEQWRNYQNFHGLSFSAAGSKKIGLPM